MKKQKYLAALMQCNAVWIASSLATPNKYMRPIDLLLHKIALRKKGAVL